MAHVATLILRPAPGGLPARAGQRALAERAPGRGRRHRRRSRLSFVALGRHLRPAARTTTTREVTVNLFTGSRVGTLARARGPARRPALDHDVPLRHRDLGADPPLLDRLHARREDYRKFFLYLNLFVFSMLLLVLANNLVLTFVGWEGVGRLLVLAGELLLRPRHRGLGRQEGLHLQPRRRRRAAGRDVPALHATCTRSPTSAIFAARRHCSADRSRRWSCWRCCSPRRARAPRSRSSTGCPTRWRARRRCRR